MIGRAIPALVLLTAFPALAAVENPVVLPDLTSVVELNSADPNRFVCPDRIKDVVVSERRRMNVAFQGREAYIKFPVTQNSNGETVYATEPAEMFIVCGDSTYHIIATPRRMTSRTVMLSSGASDRIKKNADMYAGMPYEEKILSIVRAVQTGAIPDSFTVRRMNSQVDLFREVLLTRVLNAQIDGEGLVASEYAVTLKKDVTELGLLERNFIVSGLVARPAAIAVHPHFIKQGETARLIVVERKEKEGN